MVDCSFGDVNDDRFALLYGPSWGYERELSQMTCVNCDRLGKWTVVFHRLYVVINADALGPMGMEPAKVSWDGPDCLRLTLLI